MCLPIVRSDYFATLHHLDAFALAELQAARFYHVPWQGRGAGGEEVSWARQMQVLKQIYIYIFLLFYSMASLLTKFRIKYSELIMLKGVQDQPRHDTILKHKRLIEPFRRSARNEFGITDEELHSMAEKTQRQLRIHELVVKHSSNASLVVMSLPMPRKVCMQTKHIPDFIPTYIIIILIAGGNFGAALHVVAGNANVRYKVPRGAGTRQPDAGADTLLLRPSQRFQFEYNLVLLAFRRSSSA